MYPWLLVPFGLLCLGVGVLLGVSEATDGYKEFSWFPTQAELLDVEEVCVTDSDVERELDSQSCTAKVRNGYSYRGRQYVGDATSSWGGTNRERNGRLERERKAQKPVDISLDPRQPTRSVLRRRHPLDWVSGFAGALLLAAVGATLIAVGLERGVIAGYAFVVCLTALPVVVTAVMLGDGGFVRNEPGGWVMLLFVNSVMLGFAALGVRALRRHAREPAE